MMLTGAATLVSYKQPRRLSYRSAKLSDTKHADNSIPPDSIRASRRIGAAEAYDGHPPVNGLKMYHEVHGKGEPVVLLLGYEKG